MDAMRHVRQDSCAVHCTSALKLVGTHATGAQSSLCDHTCLYKSIQINTKHYNCYIEHSTKIILYSMITGNPICIYIYIYI